eukprot:229223-Rhodomonas_salina.3
MSYVFRAKCREIREGEGHRRHRNFYTGTAKSNTRNCIPGTNCAAAVAAAESGVRCWDRACGATRCGTELAYGAT